MTTDTAWTVLEWASAALGLLSVVLLIQRRRVGWLVQNASSLGYVFVFFHSALTGLAALQWVFIALASWAWWHWPQTDSSDAKTMAIHWASFKTLLYLLALGVLVTAGFGWFLNSAAQSKTPYVEAAVSAGSLTAQWLMSRQQIQTWFFWLLVNLATVALCIRDKLWPTAALYALFALLALWGWKSWREQQEVTA